VPRGFSSNCALIFFNLAGLYITPVLHRSGAPLALSFETENLTVLARQRTKREII